MKPAQILFFPNISRYQLFMKRLLFPTLLFCLPALLAAQGMNFEHGTWAEVLAKAKAENKPIFMDAYTVWCGPCKMMSNQTFPDAKVAELFNARFVNAKVDMEKGEGPGLAQQYGVALYPTLLFLDSDGSVLHRAAGFHGPNEFLELGQIALAPEKRLGGLEAKYKSGDRSPELLYALTQARGAAYDPAAGDAADEYLKTQTDLGSERNMEVVFFNVNNPYSAGFQYFVNNKQRFEEKFGQQQVAAKIEQTFMDYLNKQPDMSQAEAEKLFMAVYPTDGARLASAYRMSAARQKGDRAGYAAAAVSHYKKYPSTNPEELNEAAWTFYKVVEDKKQLKAAVKWAKKSVELQDAYYNNDTLAALYFKLKKKKPAIKAAMRSIELAKAAGEDFSQTQEMLDQIYKL